MPEFRVTDPQTNQEFILTGDSPPTEEELLQIFPSPEPTPVQDAIAGSDAAGLVYGAARPAIGAFQLGAEAGDFLAEKMGLDPSMGENITSALSEFQESRARGRDNRFVDNPEVDAQLDLQSQPLFSDPDILPFAGEMGTGTALLARMKPAAGWITNALKGLGAGTGLAVLQPTAEDENFAAQKTSQGLLGGLMGAGVPLTASGIGGAWRRLTRRGQERQAGELAAETTGELTEDVITALETDSPPLGPRNSGEAAAEVGSAEFSALQRRASQMQPSTASARRQAQDAARINEIRELGGTPEALKTKIREAEQEIGVLYKNAFSEPIENTPALAEMLDNPYVQDAAREAKKIATSEGVEQGTTQYFHLIKKALDDIVGAPAAEGGLGPTQRRAAVNARERFLGALEEANPAYGVARQEAAELYRPISQMRIGQYLEEKLIPALNEAGGNAQQRGQVLAQALRDAPTIIRRATGFRGNQALEDVLEPAQLEMISNVVTDLGRIAQFEGLAKAGNARANQVMNEIFSEQAPNALSRPIMIMNAILRRTGDKASNRTLNILAEKMLDPTAMADIMKKATSQEAANLERALLVALSQSVGDYGGEGFTSAMDKLKGEE